MDTMEDTHGHIHQQHAISLMDLQWFYSKSKVPICLAIPELPSLLRRLTEAGILSEMDSLELLGDTRPVHRVVYECLSLIEEKIKEKNIPLQNVFDILFSKPFLLKYSKLKPVLKEYQRGQFKNAFHAITDKDTRDKDLIIFTQEKVKICLAITDLFPFIYGLQDLAILSETETLKLQGDGRSVPRIVYECLSLIEKKDLKINVVFEYIFQECYQTFYPGLQVILQESSMEQSGPFIGNQCLSLIKPDNFLEFYDQVKYEISAAICERFPFLHGLCDTGLLTRIQLLKLLADKRTNSDVLYTALSLIHNRSDIELLFSYVFREPYLTYFPGLKKILKRLIKGHVEKHSPSSDLHLTSPQSGKWKSPPQQNLHRRWSKRLKAPRSKYGIRGSAVKQENCIDPSPVSPRRGKWKPYPKKNLQKRWKKRNTCRPKTGVPVMKKERIGDLSCTSARRSKWRPSIQPILQKRWHKERKFCRIRQGLTVPAMKKAMIKAVSKLKVELEFPKQVFDAEFPVKCGVKTGIFMREYWAGDPRHDRCIECENRRFTVIKFESYGGRASWKNWKRSIHCAGITLETLFQCFVLKSPHNIRKMVTILS